MAGKADPLPFAGGKARRGAIQTQVPQAQSSQHPEALQRRPFAGRYHLAPVPVRIDALEEPVNLVHGALRDPRDVEALETDPGGQWTEPGSTAVSAAPRSNEAHDPGVPLLSEDLAQNRDDAAVIPLLPRLRGDAGPLQTGLEGVLAQRDLHPLRPMEHDVALLLHQVHPGDVDIEPVGATHYVQRVHGHLGVHDVPPLEGRCEAALPEGLRGISHQERGRDTIHLSQAVTGRAGTVGGIERERTTPNLREDGVARGTAGRKGRVDPRVAGRAAQDPRPGHEEAQAVHDFAQGAHSGPGTRGAAALSHGDGRREPGDSVYTGAAEPSHGLPGAGREGLQEPPSAFPVEGVHGQGGLPRSRDPGDHDEAAGGQVQVDAAQVVLPRSPDTYPIVHVISLRRRTRRPAPGSRPRWCGPSR